MRSAFEIPIDIQSMNFTQGRKEDITSAGIKDLSTKIWFIVPLSTDEIKPGTYELDSEHGKIQVKFIHIKNEHEDLILRESRHFVLVPDEKGKPFVPTQYLTDNRGQYPCVAVEVVFPYRLDGDIPRSPGTPMTEDERERMEILGLNPMPEKVSALIATNRIIKKLSPNSKVVSASEVTALHTTHENKDPRRTIAKTISLVTTENAFKDAVADYFLGKSRETLSLALIALRREHPEPPSSEEELNALVLSAIDKVLTHHIETRRLVHPFWDGSRTIKHDGKELEVPRSPKSETEIQPTLHVLLQMALEPFGVHVIRESDEGSGSLDFRFAATANSEPISIAAEFKLAQHKELKAGISRQLPMYMDSIPCMHGIFILMWFKDIEGKFYSEPKGRSIEDVRNFLKDLASKPSNPKHTITSRVIDCSIRPSASKLR
ncbi:hypothetical protein ACKI1H_31040 [Pseudomonas sp. YH-1]|uniref:hypothetical protein n=1 Tax=Pseudomonas sp. YH-1 TaxID=3384787 RepID=UPI003F7F6B5C